MEFVFFHGWGLGAVESFAPLQRALARRMPRATFRMCDLGFFSPMPSMDWHGSPVQPRIAICHSLGLLWFLRHCGQAWDAVVSLAGFPRFVQGEDFSCGVPLRILTRMESRLGRDGSGVLNDFRKQCSLENCDSSLAHMERLAQGLAWLREWDERESLAGLTFPLLSLAAPDDSIVPAALFRRVFADQVWLDSGGHGIPVTQAEVCADRTHSFLGDLRLA